MIGRVVLWSNGMVMVFDEFGEQMPGYQGRVTLVLNTVLREAPDATLFEIGDWRHGTVPTSRLALTSFAEQLGSG